MISLVKEDLDS